MKKARILVADDHEVVRRGMRALLESRPGWEVCGEAAGGRETVEKAKQLRPDVVVLDIGMPDVNGLEATRQILKAVPQAEVLILTMHGSEGVVREALAAGARGYVLKSDAGRNLVAAVEALCRHEPFLTAHVTEFVMDGFVRSGNRAGGEDSPWHRLSGREREVALLLAEGKANKEVACALGISVKTVEAHRIHAMHKLKLHSLGDLVRYAIRNKLIEP